MPLAADVDRRARENWGVRKTIPFEDIQNNFADPEWLGDKWFVAFGAALKEAEAKKNYLGYCDEY